MEQSFNQANLGTSLSIASYSDSFIFPQGSRLATQNKVTTPIATQTSSRNSINAVVGANQAQTSPRYQ